MAFWGAELKPNDHLNPSATIEDGFALQLAGVSLTPAAKQGDRVFLYVETEDEKFVIAVLIAGATDFVQLNLLFPVEQEIKFSTSGASTPVHITGIVSESPEPFDEDDEDGVFDEEDDESDEGEEDEIDSDKEAKLKLLRAKAGSKIKEIHDVQAKPAKGAKHEEKPKEAPKPKAEKHEEKPKAAETPKVAKQEEKAKAAETPKAVKHEEKAKAAETPKAAKQEEKAKAAETPKAAKQEEKAKAAETPKAVKHEEKAKAAETPKATKEEKHETNGKRSAEDDGSEKSDKKPKTAPNTPGVDSVKCSCGKSFKQAGGLDAHKKSTGHN